MLNIGSRLELFVDDAIIERLERVEQRLHHPVPREIALVHDAPWEGNSCGYYTVFQDAGRYRMYCRGGSAARLLVRLVGGSPTGADPRMAP